VGCGFSRCREAYDRILSPAYPFDPITSSTLFSLYSRFDPGAIFVKNNTTVSFYVKHPSSFPQLPLARKVISLTDVFDGLRVVLVMNNLLQMAVLIAIILFLLERT
jgi:hypothetical protein